ncbi:Uncharacterised protein [Vibrio cholerae]|nr:Uncharacterised protein [Vibrio cholerae]
MGSTKACSNAAQAHPQSPFQLADIAPENTG